MTYCERCHVLGIDKCPVCGGKLRQPQVNDPVLLEKADPIRTAIIESVLEGDKIPYSKVGRMGAALSMQTGGMLEEYSIFVPYGAFEQALALTTVQEDAEEADESLIDDVDDEMLLEEEFEDEG